MLYTLQAAMVPPTGDIATESLGIIADNDFDAIIEATHLALDFSTNRPDSPWAMGIITLAQANRKVMQTIPAQTAVSTTS